jgi:hypothetical protein
MEKTMFTSLKKLTCPPKPWRRLGYTLTVLVTTCVPALYCFDAQRDYFYLSVLIHNANAPAFKKQLDQIAVSSAHVPAFKQMLTTLARDVEHALLNTQAMRGADISGSIADNGYSQLKWGVGETVVAGILFKFHPALTKENAKMYYGILATGFGSGILAILSLKNSVSTYFLARRYGKHIQTTLEALEEIKKQIALHLKA